MEKSSSDHASPPLPKAPPSSGVITTVQTANTNDKEEAAPSDQVRDKQGKLAWMTDLGKAHRRAQDLDKPVLVSVMTNWCPVCQALKKTFQEKQVQAELAGWVLVHVDVTSRSDHLGELQTNGVPTLFIRTASGRPIASRVGGLPAEALVKWLKKHHEAALDKPDDVLLAPGTPDSDTVTDLVGLFEHRNPADRQAAIRQLIPWPDVSRRAVVKAFTTGRLSEKLSALEVLRRWNAPIGKMDPWQPQTFGREAIARLEEWAEESTKGHATTQDNNTLSELKPLDEEQLAEARVEIDRLLKGDEAGARATAERLATFGPSLLDEVGKRLELAETDHDLRRLRMLRYRLLSSDSLVLRWPGGLTRLADDEPRERQKAAAALVKRTKSADAPLLLALCGDADPMIREIALRGLQAVGGDEATGAMAKMLGDPEPNVRAAVLKRLEEKPQAFMVPKVTKYIETEKDPDLLVHAVRFLRVSKDQAAVESLWTLLKHDVWQVRAEAAVALGEVADDMPDEIKAKSFAALIKLLGDTDAFVVSRAVEGISGEDLPAAAEPLIEAAQRHPNLAPSIIETVARKSKMRAKALPKLREMLKHKDPRVRTAVINGLAQSESSTLDKEVVEALNDSSREVRIAAAGWLFGTLDQNRKATYKQIKTQKEARLRPQVSGLSVAAPKPTFMQSLAKMAAVLVKDQEKKEGKEKNDAKADSDKPNAPEKLPDKEPAKEKPKAKPKPKEKPDPYDAWLAESYAGKHQPPWAEKAKVPLRKMADSDNPAEKMAAVMVLVPLGEMDQVSPLLIELLQADRELRDSAIRMLPWLVWKERSQLFNTLLEMADGPQDYVGLVTGLSAMPDRRATSLLWNLLGKDDTPKELTAMVQHGLSKAYLGDRYYSPSRATPEARKALSQDSQHWAKNGNESQRIVGLSLLSNVAPDEAAKIALPMLDDPSLAAERRRDIFSILIVGLNNKSQAIANKLAVEKLANDETLRPLALAYLAGDIYDLRMSSDGFPLSYSFTIHGFSVSSGKPIVPKAPKGIKPDHVLPMLHDKNPKTAAYAGYLLALLRKPEGLPPLMNYWKALEHRDWDKNRLVVRAVAALNDGKHVETLRKIYKETDRWHRRELYWTIRIMTDDEILELRKQIRDEVGMNNLK